jgi:hypothetical protein
MAIHIDTASMLKESLPELFLAAEYCVTFQKDPSLWGAPGCYGFPAAVMLFTITDTIGSFHRGDKSFTMIVDGKKKTIDNDGAQHFYILNSIYFGLQLSESRIEKLYKNYRSVLLHNASMPLNHTLGIGLPSDPVFTDIQMGSIMVPIVNLVPFLEATRVALIRFLQDIDSIVPTSHQVAVIQKKK